jgi:hypothetical protein
VNPTLEQIVDALIECAPPVIATVAVKRARCIAATMTGLTVLEHFGVTATPRPVAVECFNPILVAWVREHPDAWPPSKADAADLERRGAKVLLTGPVRVTADGFPGHLVIAIDAITVDLDTQQFARPDAGIAMPPAVAFQWPEYPDPVGWEAEGSLLIYRALDDDSWRSGVDVGRRNDRVFRWVAGQIIRAMRRTLRATEHGPCTFIPS